MWPGSSTRPSVLLAMVCVAAGLAGCSDRLPTAAARGFAQERVATLPVRTEPTRQQLELGRKVYNFRCYFCHGYSGDARTLATSYLERKPRDFRNTPMEVLSREAMLAAVRDGRPGSAMKGFTGILSAREMEAVTDFVRHEFMANKAENTRYHTPENGWPDHDRNAVAFPFARGDIALDTPWDRLSQLQQRGKRLFMSACISCHDHGRVESPGTVWESRPLSYPRDGYCTSCHQDVPRSEPRGVRHPQRPATHTFSEPDGSVPIRAQQAAGTRLADAYLVHDKAPSLKDPTALEQRGERLFQNNCAFCHAADGTSKSWIGSFLEPHPRDLTNPQQMRGMTPERLRQAIAEGLPGTSMPAWKGVLSPSDIPALMAYISRAFHPIDGVARQ